MKNRLLVFAAVCGVVAISALPAVAQGTSLSPSGGAGSAMGEHNVDPIKPFADLNIDHTKTYAPGELSEQQRAQVSERCQMISQNKGKYQPSAHVFCEGYQ